MPTMRGMLATLVPFLIACTAVAAVPGQSTALIIRQSIRGGKRAGVATVLGNESGVFVWGCAAAFGFTALLAASQIAYAGMRVVGACVLVWFGVQSFRSARRMKRDEAAQEPDELDDDTRTKGALWSYRAGLLTNLANPKAAIFAMSFLPQFVPAHAGAGALLVCVAAWIAADLVWYSALALLVTRLGQWLRRENVKRWLERTSGGLLIGFGVTVAIEG